MTDNDYISEAEALSDNLETYLFSDCDLYLETDIYFIELWQELKDKGYVWQDRYGIKYSADKLKKKQKVS